ncbi:MAG: hypothetical protein JWO85_2249 [Candidatus Eremiobacteraeota bacterium]|nr:hypothetical protein [Candidatus Eremiobacteraeota bacterium]
MTRTPFPTLRRVTACAKAARCQCRARGVVTVRGYGRAMVAFYRDRLSERVSGGYTSGGPNGRLSPDDFATEAMQAVLVPAFALAVELASPTAPEAAA